MTQKITLLSSNCYPDINKYNSKLHTDLKTALHKYFECIFNRAVGKEK